MSDENNNLPSDKQDTSKSDHFAQMVTSCQCHNADDDILPDTLRQGESSNY